MNETPPQPSGFDVPRFCARFLAEDHNGLLGLRYVSHSADHLELELPYDPRLADGRRSGGMADGAIMTLLDMAGTISVWSRIDRWRPHATIDLRVDHLVPPRPSAVRCRVNCYHVDDELARVEGTASADGQRIASFAATYAFTDIRA